MMKHIELYVKESYRLSLNPLTEWATHLIIAVFITSALLTAIGKLVVSILTQAHVLG